jgi:hypothetical protein
VKTLGFILTVDTAQLFFERIEEIEKSTGRVMTKLERQGLLMEMVSRNEADLFVDDDCPEMVERKLMRKGAIHISGKKIPPEGGSPGGKSPSV